MHCQRGSLYEGFVAPFLWADVGPVAAMYSFYRIALAMISKTTVRCPYHDEQDHSFVQTLYHKYCMQKLLHFHCYFAVNCRSHRGQFRAGYSVAAAAVACIRFGRVAPRNSSAALAFAAAAGRVDYSSRPAPCVVGTVAQRRRQQRQDLFHSTYS